MSERRAGYGAQPWGPTLLRMLWLLPVSAVPFAIFFGTVTGGTWTGYVMAYRVSLVFAGIIMVAIECVTRFLMPFLERRLSGPHGMPVWIAVLAYMSVSVISSMVAAVVVNGTIVPGMLGSMRALLVTGMYAVLFSALVTGIAFSWVFYKESLRRARSEQELEMARRIQRSFLITQFPESPRLEIHALNRSSREVSGDFYDVVPSGESSFLVAVADVSGKGVPAALLTSMLQASLRTQAAGAVPVGTILSNVNGLVVGTAPAHQFATFFLARVDESRLTLEYSNAGHNPPLLVRRDGTVRTLETGGTVVGFLPGVTYEQETLTLVPGDRLVIYSDGVTEAEAADREQYGEERLQALLAALPAALNAQEIIERVLADVDRHLGGLDAGDDITLLVLRVTEAPPRA